MLRDQQVRLFGLFLVMTIIAIALAISATWFTLALIQLIAIFSCVEVVCRNLPRSIRRVRNANCRRADRTWSSRRARIEQKSSDRLRLAVFQVLVVAIVPLNVLVWIVHTELIPVPIAIEAISSFEAPTSAWKENLAPTEQRYDRTVGISAVPNAEARKRMLWNGWPILVLVGLVALCMAIAFTRYALLHVIQRYADKVHFRRQQYEFTDGARASQQEGSRGIPRRTRRRSSKFATP